VEGGGLLDRGRGRHDRRGGRGEPKEPSGYIPRRYMEEKRKAVEKE
jgi:hypothetical protein